MKLHILVTLVCAATLCRVDAPPSNAQSLAGLGLRTVDATIIKGPIAVKTSISIVGPSSIPRVLGASPGENLVAVKMKGSIPEPIDVAFFVDCFVAEFKLQPGAPLEMRQSDAIRQYGPGQTPPDWIVQLTDMSGGKLQKMIRGTLERQDVVFVEAVFRIPDIVTEISVRLDDARAGKTIGKVTIPRTPSAAGGYNDHVHQGQVKLRDFGYNPGPSDGIWGTRTEAAVRAFQKDHGLSITGKIDAHTRAKLGLPEVETPARQDNYQGDTTQSPTNSTLREKIGDSTLFKLLMLDRAHNLVGIGWEDREREAVGLTVINRNMKGIASKYGFKVPTREEEFDMELPSRLEGGGAGTTISLSIPADAWYELFHLRNWGKLPTVKYRGGSLSLNIKSMKVGFSEGTCCVVGGKEYAFVNGQWEGAPGPTGE